jgi:hypothetical protein
MKRKPKARGPRKQTRGGVTQRLESPAFTRCDASSNLAASTTRVRGVQRQHARFLPDEMGVRFSPHPPTIASRLAAGRRRSGTLLRRFESSLANHATTVAADL